MKIIGCLCSPYLCFSDRCEETHSRISRCTDLWPGIGGIATADLAQSGKGSFWLGSRGYLTSNSWLSPGAGSAAGWSLTLKYYWVRTNAPQTLCGFLTSSVTAWSPPTYCRVSQLSLCSLKSGCFWKSPVGGRCVIDHVCTLTFRIPRK